MTRFIALYFSQFSSVIHPLLLFPVHGCSGIWGDNLENRHEDIVFADKFDEVIHIFIAVERWIDQEIPLDVQSCLSALLNEA
jgi:hypothetical protein